MDLLNLIIKYCKKAVSIMLIFLMLVTCSGFKANDYTVDETTKINLLNQAQVMQWEDFDKILGIGARFIMVDYQTGKYMVCERHMGGLHADVETIDEKATGVLKSMYNDRGQWKHRPVLIILEDGSIYCASSFIVGHAGRDDSKFLEIVDNRSNGYGRGENYDYIKGNGLDGHICIHVENSKNHFDGKISEPHQKNIQYLKNEKLKLK
ncbi:MAG: hypothetical protein ACRCX2_35750 [Paraclostridium sp.]